MTPVLPEIGALPSGLLLDGELVAWKGSDPYFPLVCRRVLNRDMSVPLTFVIFDLLRRDGVDLTNSPYGERRQQLEGLKLDGERGRPARSSATGGLSSPQSASSASRAWSQRTIRVSTARTIAAG